MATKTVCMLSDMHDLYDDRIYWKESLSLKKEGYNVVHIGFNTKESDHTSKEGIRIITVKKTVFHNNIFVHKILKTLAFNNPHKEMLHKAIEVKADVYHIHDFKVNKIGQKLKNLPWKPKLIYDIHENFGDMIRFFHRKKKFAFLLKWYALLQEKKEVKRIRNYDYLIPAYPNIEEKFKKSTPAISSTIIYNFNNLQIDEKYLSMPKVFDLIYTGSMNWVRGTIETIKAVEILKNKLPDIKLLLLGHFSTPDYKEYILNYVKEKKLEDNVIYKSSVPHSEIHSYYAKSKIGMAIFHPIKIYTYAIQIKTFEYMAFGLPIVCSNFGMVNKFVSESKTGIPVDPLNPQKVADAIEKLLTQTSFFNEISKNGINAAKTKYNWNIEEKKLVSIYQTILQ